MSDVLFDPADLVWVISPDDVERLCDAIEVAFETVLDLETTGLDEQRLGAAVVLASLTLPMSEDDLSPTTWILPLHHPESPWLGTWREVLGRVAGCVARSGGGVIGHNVKFDTRWVVRHCGVDLSRRIVWDTSISSHLLNENSSARLKVVAPETFGIEAWDDFDLSKPGAALMVPLIDLGTYAAQDTYWTWRLAVVHRARMFVSGYSGAAPDFPDEIEEARMGALAAWCAMPTVSTLAEVEARGMILDTAWVDQALAERRLLIARVTADLATRYEGMDPDGVSFAPTAHWFRDWSAKAVLAGDLVVSEMTPTGKPKWAKNILVRQARRGSEVAQKLLDLRRATKAVEYLSSWLDCRAADLAVHTTYHAGQVVTGRLASSGPNMQQVNAALKPAFVPRPGFYFADFDYSQIELRVAAFIARCEPMLEAFRRGDDLHTLLAARITGKRPEDVTPFERQAGKSANFGLLYRMGAYGFRAYAEDNYDVSFTMEEAHAVVRAFFDTWKGMAEWHARSEVKARATGQVTSPIGRVRRLPEIFSDNDAVSSYAARAAVNSPVQGFASDLMQIAAASIAGLLPGYARVPDCHIVATVHDSILVEVPIRGWEHAVAQCRDRMLNVDDVLVRLGCALDVPLAVSVKVGTRWGVGDVAEL